MHIFLDVHNFQQILKGVHNSNVWEPSMWEVFFPPWEKIPRLMYHMKISSGKPTRDKDPWHNPLTMFSWEVGAASSHPESWRSLQRAAHNTQWFFNTEHRRRKSGVLFQAVWSLTHLRAGGVASAGNCPQSRILQRERDSSDTAANRLSFLLL